ncbi:MAG: S-layer homology domain-containing protein [Cellulosilyticaceae bacterium]
MISIKRKFKKQLSLFLALCMCVMTIQGMPLIAITEEYCGAKEGYTLDTTKWGLETDSHLLEQEELKEFINRTPTKLVIDVSDNKQPTITINNRTTAELKVNWGDGEESIYNVSEYPESCFLTKPSEYHADQTTASIIISIEGTVPSEANKIYRLGRYVEGIYEPISTDLISIEAGTYSAIGTNAFNGCEKLENADLTKCSIFNYKVVFPKFCDYTNLSSMFNGCAKLTDVKMPSYSQSDANVEQMFQGCTALTTVNWGEFKSLNIANMNEMFKNCTSLKTVDLMNFSNKSDTTMSNMFENCNKLEQLTLGANFILKGTEAALPAPNPNDIDWADGKWHDIDGNAYEPSKVHEGATTAETYFATNPNYTPEIKINSYSSDIVEIVGTPPSPITVDATVSGNREISYKWYKSETQDKDNSILIQESESPECVLPNNLAKGEYYYYCELSAPDCSDVSTDMIKVSIRDGSVLDIDLEKLNYGEDNTPTIHIQNNTDKEIYIDGGDGNNTSTKPHYYQIEIPEIEGGTIYVPNNGKVQEGESITITITPDGNFEIADVIIDGVSVEPVTDYTFTNVRDNHTIEVIFKEKTDDLSGQTDDLSGQNDDLLNRLNHNAYMKGYRNNEFRPNNNMTRAEVIVMFSRLMKLPMNSSKVYASSFIDVDSSNWYANELGYMERFSIVKGYSDGTFRGDMPVTIAEFITIASRFMPLEEGELIFTDVDSSYWASDAIASATAKGWINGYEDNTFRPGQTITRAEAVTIVNRMLGRNCAEEFIIEHLEETSNVYTDVTLSNLAYDDIYEASNTHEY